MLTRFGKEMKGMLCRASLAMLSISALAALLCGCGGGTGPAPEGDTSTVEGVVYLPADAGALEAAMADGGGARDPAADCQVTCTRDRDRRRLRATTTDGQGRYRFEGLPRGEDVTITAELPNGDQLRTRVRLRNRIHRVEISEGNAQRIRGQQ
jgi:hypothetical protein